MNRLRSRPLPALTLRDALHSPLDALPDAELLDRFARYADHAAFEALLRRHGPMVFGVCRRALGNTPDADDAFQATFLVFIRKARVIRDSDRLGPWLYGVACRVAMKARSRAARLGAYRAEDAEMIPDPTAPAETPDWLPILDAELAALPAKYRDALVLCELQGVSRADAAKALGLREGTLSSRLSRGRDLLRRRLLKHGTLLPAGGLAALFSANSVGRATVPATLLTQTAELAKLGTGAAAAGAVPVGAARLTDEVLKSMFLTKLRTATGALALLVAATAGLAAGVWPTDAPAAPPAEGKGSAAKAPAPDAQPATKPAPAGPKPADRDALQGVWVLDKYEVGKDFPREAAAEAKELAGNMRFLVAGDMWWGMASDGKSGSVFPHRAALDPTKNPKWLDLTPLDPAAGRFDRCIYELDGDRLRVCFSGGGGEPRPAEFSLDSDVPLIALTFRRDKLPPAAGEKGLLGEWTGSEGDRTKVVALDGHLFFTHPAAREAGWTGGRYTVDATKNPKWIDVELAVPLDDGKVTKLYGCYEIADGKLKLALGRKRATRPLDFKGGNDTLVFDLSPRDTTPGAVLRLEAAPMPKAQPVPRPSPGGR